MCLFFVVFCFVFCLFVFFVFLFVFFSIVFSNHFIICTTCAFYLCLAVLVFVWVTVCVCVVCALFVWACFLCVHGGFYYLWSINLFLTSSFLMLFVLFFSLAQIGIHRKLGVHLSQVRSVTLDRWEHETIEVCVMKTDAETRMHQHTRTFASSRSVFYTLFFSVGCLICASICCCRLTSLFKRSQWLSRGDMKIIRTSTLAHTQV